TNAAALRQALACKLDADFRQLVGRHFDRSSVASELVLYFQLLQFLNDALGFLGIQVRIQCLVFDSVHEVDESPQRNQHQSSGSSQHDLLLQRITLEEDLNLF